MLSTRRLLEQVVSPNRDDELITTPARREILREHLYRELTKGAYSPDERKIWAYRLQRLLEGSVAADLRCHLIDVRLGVDSTSLKDMKVVAREGEQAIPVEITELNERQIEVLIPTEVPPEEPWPEGPAEEKGPALEKPPSGLAEPEGPGPTPPEVEAEADGREPVAEREKAAAKPDTSSLEAP
jgi:hypothetical protein